jgi:6-phosphogluconolactonase (cycloisomerase 2 family)
MKKYIITIILFPLLVACSSDKLTYVVGTYTAEGSYGIYSLRFDQSDCTATILDSVAAVNPSFVIPSKNGRYVYAVSEITPDDSASVTVYKFNRKKGSFRKVGEALTGGGDPCHLSTNGKMLVCSNYSGGNLTVFRLRRNGRLARKPVVYPGSTGGPDALRQALPHIHCSVFSPDGKYLYASDFSADRLLRFNVEGKRLIPSADAAGKPVSYRLDDDYGPRHIEFSPDGKSLCVIGELSGSVTAFRYNDGDLFRTQVVTTDPYAGRGSADLHFSPDGRFLYTSNRLVSDGISIMSVSREGALSYVTNQATRIHPRNFTITPNGKYLLSACRDSHCIQVFSRDSKTGLLTDTGLSVNLSQPVCLSLVR